MEQNDTIAKYIHRLGRQVWPELGPTIPAMTLLHDYLLEAMKKL